MNGEVVPDVTQLDGSWYYMPAMTHAAVESVSEGARGARRTRRRGRLRAARPVWSGLLRVIERQTQKMQPRFARTLITQNRMKAEEPGTQERSLPGPFLWFCSYLRLSECA